MDSRWTLTRTRPRKAGARQPGLTGQVKEDFICRMGELGVFVKSGEIHFRPALLRREEFLTAPAKFACYDVAGLKQQLHLKAGTLAFTFCQVPIIYQLARENLLSVVQSNGAKLSSNELRLGVNTSRLVFERAGKILRIEVSIDC